MNNIFEYAPSELVQDAFLSWILNFANSDVEEEKTLARNFVEMIINLDEGKENIKEKIKKIEINRQYSNAKIDVYAKIEYCNEKKLHLVFENKLHTSYHNGQLKKHEESMKEKLSKEKDVNIIFIYYKLGYILERESEEKIIPFKHLKLEKILEFLEKNKMGNNDYSVYNMYHQFLKELKKKREKILELLKDKNLLISTIDNEGKKKYYKRDEVFQDDFGCFKVLKKIKKTINMEIGELKTGSSYGRPWAQLVLLNKTIEKVWFGVFWRLDWRMHNKEYTPYLSLRIYRGEKNSRNEMFEELREKYIKIFNKLKEKYEKLNYGKIHNSANMEKEIGIIFFEEANSLDKIFEIIPKITEEFLEKVKEKNLDFE